MTDFQVGIVGLGYVGLTLATALAEANVRVLGVEKRGDVVDLTNSGVPHFAETGLEHVLQRVVRDGVFVASTTFPADATCDTYIISVGTPLGNDGAVRFDFLEHATQEVAEHMTDGALVILRSTVKVGTARDVVAPILAATGKRFSIAMCPERTLEGNAMTELRTLPQIVGADDRAVRDRAASLFSKLTKIIIQVSSLEAAEIIKLVDNTYRDIQFGFANEVARACECFNVSAYEVIQSGKQGYSRTNVPMPGLVGGPCLSKDPHILSQSLAGAGIELEITRAGRLVNERQPEETVGFIDEELKRRRIRDDAPIALLGVAFKGVPETDDLRGAMSLKVIDAIKAVRPAAPIRLFDPVIGRDQLSGALPDHAAFDSIEDAISGSSVAIIANNHPALGRVGPKRMAETMLADAFIYDYWNHFSSLPRNETAEIYFAVGNRGGV